MDSVSFPSEMQAFALIEKSLDKELSLDQIGAFEEQIFDAATTSKTREIGQRLLGRLDAKRDKLIEKKLSEMNEMKNPLERIAALRSLIYFLPPEEVERQMEVIAMDTALLDPSDRKIQELVSREVEHLYFEINRPIVHELDENTPCNFAEKAKKIAEAIRDSNSLLPLKDFSPEQIREIFHNPVQGRSA